MVNSNSLPKIGEEQIRLLERLCNASAVSGAESEVRRIVLDEIRQPVAEAGGTITVDSLGNVLVTPPGAGSTSTQTTNRTRLMVAAHMDEIGLMVTGEDGEGIFRFDTVGGLDTRQLIGKAVVVGKERLPGIIGAKPIHLTTAEERKSPVAKDALRIDVGPENTKKVKIGDRATFATSFRQVGGSLMAKALDDRFGVAILVELVKHPPANVDLLAAFTVQEEIGLRGAHVAAYALDPQAAMVIDSTPALDLPAWDGTENERYNTRLGAGPAIYLADRGTLSDPRLIRHLVETADQLGIPYQFRQPGGGGTDAGAIHKQRAGIPSVSVSIPGRYLHTAVAIARRSDWENTMALVYAALASFTPEILAVER
jgi:putative aminopeptidase FrvX